MPRVRETEIERLTAAAYEAALDPSLWQSVADDLRRIFSAATVSITGYDWSAMQGFIINAGADPDMIASYLNHYVKIDPVTPQLSMIPAGQLRHTNEICPSAQVERTEYYTDWLRPQKLLGGLVGNTIRSSEMMGGLAVAREIGARDFDRFEVAALGKLAPHLGRAVRTSYHVAAARGHTAGTLDLVDRLPHAALLLDRDGTVHHCNAPAAGLLARSDGLSTQAAKLRTDFGRDQARLDTAIAQASAGAGLIVPVERRSGLARLIVSLQPLGRSLPSADPLRIGRRPNVLALIADLSQNRPRRVAEALRAAYALTAAETRVLSLLAAGNSPAEIARQLDIEVTTVRTHLQRLFLKTEVSRQSDLTRIYERIAAVTSDDG